MQIRSLSARDAAAFQTLRLQGLRECPTAFASSFEEECDLPLSTIADRLTPSENDAVFGAFADTGLVGLTGLHREPHRKLSHKAIIWGVYVAPEWRRQGVGRRLMVTVLEYAASLPGLRRVNLGVNAANTAAIALYESLGFQSFGVERDYLLVDGTLHDEIHMVWNVPSV